MEMVIAGLVIFFFGLGWLLLTALKARISEKEAAFITRKYYGWLPVAVFYLAIIFSRRPVALVAYTLVAFTGWVQIAQKWQTGPKKLTWLTSVCLFFLIITTTPFLWTTLPSWLLLLVSAGSAMSDVGAYTASAFFGKHQLPDFINPAKTYEGVIGGLIGPFVALLILMLFGLVQPSLAVGVLTLIIGFGANLGDIANSIVKRGFAAKDWGELIPGHGGVYDRLGSFYSAYAAVCVWVLIIK